MFLNAALSRSATLDEMIGQMLLVGFDGSDVNSRSFKETLVQLEGNEIGGVIFFEKNIKDKKNLEEMTKKIAAAQKKAFISIDQEGGLVQRLNEKNGSKRYPSAANLVKTGSLTGAYNIYYEMAKELKEMGFNYNFGPCVDLTVNSKSLIARNERGYSSNPEIVEKYAHEFMKAHNKNGLITSLKHFPGHGSPSGDTHLGFVDATETWNNIELEPYRVLLKDNSAKTVMISHIFNSRLDPKYPATLSYATVTKLLRQNLHYNGVIVTDDLDMGAIKDNYSLEEIVVGAINAGVDILLFSNFKEYNPELVKNIHEIVKNAVKSGKISDTRLKESYDRILRLKESIQI